MPKVILIIIKLNIILNKNKVILLKSKKRIKILIEPINDPKNTLFNLTFLFKVILTVNNSRKSKKKFKKNKASKYIVIVSP